MRTRVLWPGMLAMALGLVVLRPSQSMAQQAPATTEEQQAPSQTEAPAAPAGKHMAAATEKPAGLVGTVAAVEPASQTLVVDVPLGKEVLRVGAFVTPSTKIEAGGKSLPLASLQAGERVRMNFRRIATGDQALAVDVLSEAKG